MTLWSCPKCSSNARTVDTTTPMHRCRGLAGLLVPLIPDGTKAKLTVVEREDYIGRELAQTDAEGRPVMAVTTTRDDGQDCTVYAPCARQETE